VGFRKLTGGKFDRRQVSGIAVFRPLSETAQFPDYRPGIQPERRLKRADDRCQILCAAHKEVDLLSLKGRKWSNDAAGVREIFA
jgi:hypothetical protein